MELAPTNTEAPLGLADVYEGKGLYTQVSDEHKGPQHGVQAPAAPTR